MSGKLGDILVSHGVIDRTQSTLRR